MHYYTGAFHLHSKYSYDGNVDIKEIIESARACGVDFVVITDHFRLDARNDGWEGWHDGVLVIVGEEISPRYNHYLAFGIEKPVIARGKSSVPQEYINEVNAQGGFGLITHPDHTGAAKYGVKAYPWQDWSVSGYSGISIWDFMTDWQEKLTHPIRAIFSIMFPAWVLSGPKKQTLKRWDELNKKGKCFGYGEMDNHNTPKNILGRTFRIFPYSKALKLIRTNILIDKALSDNPAEAQKQVFEALKSSSAYVSQDYWHSSKGFRFYISTNLKTGVMGDEINYVKDRSHAIIKLPRSGRIKLICDGKTENILVGKDLQIEISKPGVYRAEVEQKVHGIYKPWIYSNPIWVK